MNSRFLEQIVDLIKRIDEQQYVNIKKAADLIVDTFENDGIVQTFGSGHSYAAAIELVERAGGFVATKLIKDPAMGVYETLEGVGEIMMRKVDIRPEDVVIVISYSGRNPQVVEIAKAIKQRGAKIIAVTSLDASKGMDSRHSKGGKLHELADVCLDMMGGHGDASIQVDPLPEKVCPMSSVAAASLIQATLLEVVEKMVAKGIMPDIRISANIDGGGLARSLELSKKYAHRIYRI